MFSLWFNEIDCIGFIANHHYGERGVLTIREFDFPLFNQILIFRLPTSEREVLKERNRMNKQREINQNKQN
jgi:hypothetical protein